jgi:hypothetical protein
MTDSRGDRLRALSPDTGRIRTFSTRYGIKTRPLASGPGSGGSTISPGAGSLSMGTRKGAALWARALLANTAPAAAAASALMGRFMA